MTAEFPSLAEFYAADRDRATSGESDYGVHWQAGGRDWPRWRVSYVQATGEVYAAEQRGTCRVRVLGVVPPDPDERDTCGCWCHDTCPDCGRSDCTGEDCYWPDEAGLR